MSSICSSSCLATEVTATVATSGASMKLPADQEEFKCSQ